MILGYLLIFSAIGTGLLVLLTIVGVALFDIQKIRKQRRVGQHPYMRRYRARPLISVLILATDDQNALERCLDSLVKSSYKKIEIIVVDTQSRSKLKRMVNEYAQVSSVQNVAVFTTKRSEDKAITAAYRRHGNGGLVAIVDGSSAIDSRLFNYVVWEFNVDQKVQAVLVNDRLKTSLSSVRILQNYENLMKKLSLKTKSAFNISYSILRVNIVYRKEALLTSTFAHKHHRTVYASDALLYKDMPRSVYSSLCEWLHSQRIKFDGLIAHRPYFFALDANYTKFATWIYLPFTIYLCLVALLVPFLLGYFIFLALAVHQPLLFLLSWAFLGALLLFAIWSDEHASQKHKLTYSALLPITFVVAYFLSVLQLFAAIGFTANILRRQ